MLQKTDNYTDLYRHFEWNIPEFYNIGEDVCDRVARETPQRLAIIDVASDGTSTEISFEALRKLSNQCANALTRLGIHRGNELSAIQFADRVGVLLPQQIETAVAHIAVCKIGCISIPLFTLFGEDALVHRLRDSGAKAIITDHSGSEKINRFRDRLPDLEYVVSVDGPTKDCLDFNTLCQQESAEYAVQKTRACEPAFLIYTSGTTGPPKGALHAHQVLLGHLPGVEMAFNFLPQPGDRFWTPADWAWIGGLLDVLMPSLHHGITVIAHRFTKFSPQAALDLIATFDIKNVFLPPTAMKLMRRDTLIDDKAIQLRSVGSGGESLPADLITWGEKTFGVTVNEFYGQTECNMVVSSCSALEAPSPGIMGRAVPGHQVDVIDVDTGTSLDCNDEGAIAVLHPDPVMFIGYWNNPVATHAKFVNGPTGKWLLTGDRGIRLPSGQFKFVGRDDDVITSAGYRIGPGEVENCLLRHPAVQLAGVVAKPDDIRGSIVAAYIQLNPTHDASITLELELCEFVRSRLAAHEYPRAVRFLDALPMTTTGKIIRSELRKLALSEYQRDTENPPT